MFDTDKFIVLVHDQPSLWDKACKDYSNRVQRDKSWLAVATEMFTDWNDVDMKEKDIRGKELRNKWRHLRDEFFRQMNKSKSGDPAPKKKKKTYIWAEALNFLLNSATKRNTSGNLDGNELNEESDENVDDVETTEGQQENESAADVVPVPTVRPKPKTLGDKTHKNSKLSPFQDQLLKKLDASKVSEEDTDRMFLLSMLPEYKDLDREEKLDFKLMALQFFSNARQKKRVQSQMLIGPQFHFNMQNYEQQQHYMSQTSSQSRPPTTLHPPSAQSVPDQFYMSQTLSQTRPITLRPPSAQSLPDQFYTPQTLSQTGPPTNVRSPSTQSLPDQLIVMAPQSPLLTELQSPNRYSSESPENLEFSNYTT